MQQEIPNIGGDFIVLNHPEVLALRKREKHNTYMRNYIKNPKWKSYIKKYNQSDKMKAWKKEYLQKPEVKALYQGYNKKSASKPERKAYSAAYNKTEKMLAYKKSWKASQNGRKYMRLYSRKYIAERKKTDPLFKIQRNLRLRNHYIRILAANPNIRSNARAIVNYLGLPPQDGRKYHIDHIKPLCSFDLSNPAQVKLATAPKNHRWLLAKENMKKAVEDRKKSIRYGKR
jgi:hypothetical protein